MQNIRKRILTSIDVVNGCWLWTKATKGFGYGYLTIGSRTNKTRRTITAHRASYIAFKGEITDGLCVLHICDNPKCCNPEHLYLGTKKQNSRDMVCRDRQNHVFGEKVGNSILSENDVIEIIRERATNGTSYRKLAKKYGLKSHKHIIEICQRKLWKHVKPQPPKDE